MAHPFDATHAPGLDALLTLEEGAAWFRLTTATLRLHIAGRRPLIPSIHPSHKFIRFHPRTILAKFAVDSGVPLEVIAASYGIIEIPKLEIFDPLAPRAQAAV